MSARGRRAAIRLALLAAGAALAPAAGAQQPLLARGRTLDFAYDARDTRHPDEAYAARLYLPRRARELGKSEPLPFVVFLHGLNVDHSRYRFVGGKTDEPDMRLLVGEMVEKGDLPPVVFGAPTTSLASTIPLGMWPEFDLDRFVERSARALRGQATLDLDRVVVIAHSAGGCNPRGGLLEALAGTTLALRAVFSIDTCMNPLEAERLSQAPAATDVVVTWQPFSWTRPFEQYTRLFQKTPAPPGALRALEEFRPPPGTHAHNIMLDLTLRKYLARVLAARPAASPAPGTAPPEP